MLVQALPERSFLVQLDSQKARIDYNVLAQSFAKLGADVPSEVYVTLVITGRTESCTTQRFSIMSLEIPYRGNLSTLTGQLYPASAVRLD